MRACVPPAGQVEKGFGAPRTTLLAVVLLSCNFLALSLAPLSLCLARSIAEKLAAFLAPPVPVPGHVHVCVCVFVCLCVGVRVRVRVRKPS